MVRYWAFVVAVVVTASLTCAVVTAAPEERIQVNVAEGTLDSVLRIIAKIGHINILIPPELAGKTVKELQLQDVPVSEALATVLLPYGYEAVLENNVYLVRPRQGGAESLIHVGARLVRIASIDLDRLTAPLTPEQRLALPGGVSVLRAPLFEQVTSLLRGGAPGSMTESNCVAPSGKRVSVPLYEPQPKGESQGARAIVGGNELLFGKSEAHVTPELTDNGISVLLELKTLWARPGAVIRPTTLALEVPGLMVNSGDEIWVRGWLRLVDPVAAQATQETVLALTITKWPVKQ